MDAVHRLLVWMLVVVCWCPLEARGALRDTHGEPSAVAVRRLAQALGLPEGVQFSHRRMPPPPAFMLDLYNRVVDGRGRWRGPTPYDANVVRSFQEAEPISDSTLQFNVDSSSSNEELLEAELHVYVPHVLHVSHVSPVRRVRVWQVTEAGSSRPLDSSLLSAGRGWAVLHVRPAAAGRAGRHPLTLQLTEETSDGQQRQLNVTRRGRHHHHRQPLLVLYSRDNQTAHHQIINEELIRHARSVSSSLSRHRRAVEPMIPAGCERRELYIDFKDIGWSNYIVAPSGYSAYHCLGQCEFPLTQEQRPTNHATLQSLVHQLALSSPEDQVQQPSCVPTALGSVAILFTKDESKVMLKMYTDMVAEECGCQ